MSIEAPSINNKEIAEFAKTGRDDAELLIGILRELDIVSSILPSNPELLVTAESAADLKQAA